MRMYLFWDMQICVISVIIYFLLQNKAAEHHPRLAIPYLFARGCNQSEQASLEHIQHLGFW